MTVAMEEKMDLKPRTGIGELKELSRYFSRMIDIIPPKVYFNQNEDILENIEINKRAIFKDANLSNKAKNKRVKLDPNSQKKVSDVAQDFYDKQKNSNKLNDLRKKLSRRIRELREARGVTDEAPKTTVDDTPQQSESKSLNKINPETKSIEKIPKIFNKEGKLVFSKFDFSSHVDIAAEEVIEKSKQKKTSLKGLLVKAKKEDEKIIQLEKINSSAASKMKEKKMWKNALEKAEGNKVRDNPKLLEKKLKQKSKVKTKHTEAWKKRKEAVDDRIKKRQDRRKRNINDRKQQKNDRKIKILKKRGRMV